MGVHAVRAVSHQKCNMVETSCVPLATRRGEPGRITLLRRGGEGVCGLLSTGTRPIGSQNPPPPTPPTPDQNQGTFSISGKANGTSLWFRWLNGIVSTAMVDVENTSQAYQRCHGNHLLL